MIIWNPWHGCHKISEGCQHCYMYFLDGKRGIDTLKVYRTENVSKVRGEHEARFDANESEVFGFPEYQDGGHTYFHNSLIWADGEENVSITGSVYARHVDGLRLNNVEFVLQKPDERPMVLFDDVKNLRQDNNKL